MHPSRRGRRLGGGGVGWWMGLPVHLCGRGGPPAGLPCGSQIPTYSSLGVRSLRDLDHHVTACSEGARACWGGGGGCWACFRSGPISVGGGGGSKRSAPLFPGPQGEPAHGLHPRFVVAEIWADRGGGGGMKPKGSHRRRRCRTKFSVGFSRIQLTVVWCPPPPPPEVGGTVIW